MKFLSYKRKVSLQILAPAGKPETLTAGKSPPDHVPGRIIEPDEVHSLMDIEELEPCGLFTGWRKQGDLNRGRPLDWLAIMVQDDLTIFIDMIITG